MSAGLRQQMPAEAISEEGVLSGTALFGACTGWDFSANAGMLTKLIFTGCSLPNGKVCPRSLQQRQQNFRQTDRNACR